MRQTSISSDCLDAPELPPRRRIRKFSARPFYLTLLVISALCAFSLVSARSRALSEGGQTLVTRDIDNVFAQNGHDCHLVHQAPDKCAYVHAHCPDEEAGLFSYLSLYYCSLPRIQPVAFIIIVLWLCLLFSTIGIAASDFFCVNLSTIATLLGMSESLAGVTFLAFGNGSPDVFSTFAAMGSNSGSLAVGELIGAASFITAVVAGSMAVVRPFKVARRSFVRDVGFFIVAAAFSLVFLADSKLYLWESATMVGFYLFYVVFVFSWHWWLGKSRKRRQKEALARDQFHAPGSDVEPVEQYHDDEDLPTDRRPMASRATTATDLTTLERGPPEWEEEVDSDDQEEARERWLGELSNNMRVNRRRSSRRGTLNPIRPSLVGALEFRSVLAGLQKSRNIQTIPISLRRYSDDPTFTTAQQHDQLSTISDPPARPSYEVIAEYGTQNASTQYLDVKGATGSRARAVSANDVDRLDPSAARHFDPSGPINEDGRSPKPTFSHEHGTDGAGPSIPTVQVSVTPPSSEASSSRPASIRPPQRNETPQLLVTPDDGYFGLSSRSQPKNDLSRRPGSVPQGQPENNQHLGLPKLQIPPSDSPRGTTQSSPISPFPAYTDDPMSMTIDSRAPSLQLPPPGMSRESLDANGILRHYEVPTKPLRWWSYRFLPPPEVLFGTLFPTLVNWRDKNFWERLLGIASAPSVFCLAITLPVVEVEREIEGSHVPTLTLPPGDSMTANGSAGHRKNTVTILEPDSPGRVEPTSPDAHMKSIGGHGGTATIAVSAENLHEHAEHPETLPLLSATQPRYLDSPEQLPSASSVAAPPDSKDWNRWLLMIQCFTSPSFTALIVYANFLSDDHGPFLLLKTFLYSLVISLVLLALVMTTSTPTSPPKWRHFLCFAGFIVSISWISTIANEVVGVLKFLGVVLNISDAILGLTVFAVGNSLGDWVADVTVARLGYPVMALSACFGGPMLNILLGIGLSGMYMTITKAQRKGEQHPDSPLKFKPFHVDVSGTLLISGATLLVTLCCLLVAVPLRKWRMDRAIGLGLVFIWTASTISNVVVELLGLSDNIG